MAEGGIMSKKDKVRKIEIELNPDPDAQELLKRTNRMEEELKKAIKESGRGGSSGSGGSGSGGSGGGY
jgi:hypothetical protein